MSQMRINAVSPSEALILRDLAKQIRDVAHSPRMRELRRLWTLHNDLRGERPMIVIEHGGVVEEIFDDAQLRCTSELARGMEKSLRLRLFQALDVADDTVLDAELRVHWGITDSGWGMPVHEVTAADLNGRRLAHVADFPLKHPREDLHKLKPKTFAVDAEGSVAALQFYENLFGDILRVRQRGAYWWTMGMTGSVVSLVGLEQLMLLPYDDPDTLHALMAYLRDQNFALIAFLTDNNLLRLNNGNDYVGSGSYGYTTALPGPDFGGHVRPEHLWVLSESQETVLVSPDMFAEFFFPYMKQVAELFGLCYYGCCEPIHDKWDTVRTIRNLRALSVSPWCDQAFMADALRRDYVFSRKPNPTLISTGHFDEALIRKDLRDTRTFARDCELQVIMKDVHTVNRQPWRLRRWVELAREELYR